MSPPRHPGSTPRPAPLRPPRAALLVGLVLTLVVTLLGALGAPALAVPGGSPHAPSTAPRSVADDETDDGTDDGRGEDDEGDEDVEVLVTDVSPQVVRPTDEVVVRATVRNDTGTALTAPRVTLRISRFLQSTRSSLDRWADLPLEGTAGTGIAEVELPAPLPPGGTADVELRVPATELGLSGAASAWGPRGISVMVTDAGRRAGIARTFLVWLPTEEPITPTRLSLLVPLTGGPVDPAATEPDAPAQGGTGGSEPEATAPGAGAPGPGSEAPVPDPPATQDVPGSAAPPVTATAGAPADEVLDRLTAAVDATAEHPGVTWAVDPALVSAARATAQGSGPHRWVTALTDAAAGREVLTLPARDPDIAALAHADEPVADALLAEAVAAAAVADPALGGTVRTRLAWPAGAAPDLDTAILAARSGATSLLVDGTVLPPERLTYTPTGRATLPTAAGDVDALVTDPVLSAQLEGTAGTTAAVSTQRLLAETAVVTRERPNEQRHVLAAVDRGWDPDAAVVDDGLTALAAAPWVELSPLSALAATPDPAVDRPALPARDVADAEITPGRIGALTRARAALAQFTSIVPDPSGLLAGVDDAVRIPLSVAWRADPVQRAAVVDGVVTDLAVRASGVSVLPGSDLSLISESGLFPLGLRNDLPQEVTVQVAVDPAGSLLVIDEAQTVTIPPHAETQVRIPFHAVGSGDVRVAVSLLAPDGTPLTAPQEITVQVRADWENVGTAVVAGLLGLALVIGIVRTVRRGQTAKRGAGSTPVSEIARLPEESS